MTGTEAAYAIYIIDIVRISTLNLFRSLTESGATMNDDVFVARQPIVDQSGREVAYELLFRDNQTISANISDGFACSVAVVERALGLFGLDRVVGDSDAFLNCTAEFLFSDVVALLPPSRFVLEVLEHTVLTPELGQRCDELRRAGFRIALDDVLRITESVTAFLPHVDIIKLDWPVIAADEVVGMSAFYKSFGKRVLAEKIESRADHAKAARAGCDLFQGYYFSRPEVLTAKRAPISLPAVLRILDLLDKDASNAHIESALKQVPLLVVQLLRLANSGDRITARSTPIASIRQALSVVGSRQLMRWCCLLIYGDAFGHFNENDPLVRMVERRSAFMERAAKDLMRGDARFCEAAYLSGLLSLAHVRFGRDVKSFVAELPVSVAIQEAIVERRGDLGELLTLAEHLESGGFSAASDLNRRLGSMRSGRTAELVI